MILPNEPVFEKVETLAGYTLRDPITGQAMHSAIGPLPEATQIYLNPSQLSHRLVAGSTPLILWDVGMGIAANSVAAFYQASLIKNSRPLQIHSFENAPEGLRHAISETECFPHLKPWAPQILELLTHGSTHLMEHQWKLHVGDFRSQVSQAPPAEVIFFDLYSPRISGALWSVPVMELLRRHSPQATLVTYSAATPVRLALLLAGWRVGRPSGSNPVTSLKNDSTLAIASELQSDWLENPLGVEWLEKFRHSSQARPYPSQQDPQGGSDPWSTLSFNQLEALLLQHPQFQSL